MSMKERRTKKTAITITIIILGVLLILSIGVLAARIIYWNCFVSHSTTVDVPNNFIGEENTSAYDEPAETPTAGGSAEETVRIGNDSDSDGGFENSAPAMDSAQKSDVSDSAGTAASNKTDNKHKAAKLELSANKLTDNARFEVANLFPGDSVTKYFCVTAYHNADVTIFFKTTVTEQTKSLGNVLHIKVTHMDTGKVLCDASFNEINEASFSELLKGNAKGETDNYYQVEVSLDTSVGNDYQAAMLKADFEWYVEDEGGMITPPQTGDNIHLVLWVALVSGILFGIILLLWKRRKEDAGESN